MRANKIIVLVLLFIFIAAMVAVAWGLKCPTCGMGLYWTGRTKSEWGKLHKQYKCVNGHVYWFPMGWNKTSEKEEGGNHVLSATQKAQQ